MGYDQPNITHIHVYISKYLWLSHFILDAHNLGAPFKHNLSVFQNQNTDSLICNTRKLFFPFVFLQEVLFVGGEKEKVVYSLGIGRF